MHPCVHPLYMFIPVLPPFVVRTVLAALGGVGDVDVGQNVRRVGPFGRCFVRLLGCLVGGVRRGRFVCIVCRGGFVGDLRGILRNADRRALGAQGSAHLGRCRDGENTCLCSPTVASRSV